MRLSKDSNFSFQNDLTELINSYTKSRPGELHLGEILTRDWNKPEIKYVLFGISESVGPQANFGRPGAEKAFDSFLEAFCNLQWNSKIKPGSFAYFGKISFLNSFSSIEEARCLVNELDEFILELLKPLINEGKVPIVIGGGHNNAFPLIQLFSEKFQKLSILNMDAHADCREIEGRHSGNSFSYAFHMGLLSKYGVFGLHKAYINKSTIDFLNEKTVSFEYFENYSLGRKNFKTDIQKFLNSLDSTENLGIELDFDCIANFPSSAMNPIGFSISEARTYLEICSTFSRIRYYHFTEAAVIQSGDERLVGKVLSQLTYDILCEFNY
ncbi:MAG: arginase family protein [Bacteroidota bacterium]